MPAHDPAAVVCVVLAGGLGRRMGGADKALIEVDGVPMIDHIIGRLGARCGATIVNANGDPARFDRLGLPVVADVVPGALGPLAGVLSAMEWVAERHPECSHLLSVPADAPFLPDDLLDRLAAAVGEGAEIAVARSGGRTHPVVALWPVALRAALRHALIDEDMRKIDAWTARYRVVHVDWPTDPVDPFFNVNRPEDVAEAQRLIAMADQPAPPDQLSVGVVLERRPSRHPWGEDAWVPTAVVPGLAADAPARAIDADRWCSAGLPLELFRKETEGYRRNLGSEPPRVFVVLRGSQGEGPEMQPFRVTVCPYEAEAYLDGETVVEGVPMPAEIAALVQAFVDRHHRDAPFLKRKQKPKRDGAAEADPFDRLPPVERHRRRLAEGRET